MKKTSSKKIPFNIRNKLCLLGGVSLIFLLSLVVWSSSVFTPKVEAAAGGNPIFNVSLEDYLKNSNTWTKYSNEAAVSRPDRLDMFAQYYNSQINTSSAPSYGWPMLIIPNSKEYNVGHNNTAASSDSELYLLEFSTANDVKKTDIDIYYSVYFIKDNQLRYSDKVELSKDSRDFLGRTSRNQELRQGELEMTTVLLPKGAIPVGVFVFQEEKDKTNRCAWELSYLDMYKVDSISGIHENVADADSYSEFSKIIDTGHNYRTFTGTRVGYIDSESIQKKYMASRDSGKTITDGQYFEWLYPLTPVNEGKKTEYVLEVVTQTSGAIEWEDMLEAFRGAFVYLNYTLDNGMTGSRRVTIDFHSYFNSHPFRSPEDYDTKFDFDYDGGRYVNPIAQNYLEKKVKNTFSVLNVRFPRNGKSFMKGYDMQDQKFWILPESHNNNFTQMNEFAAMMLGNYFDVYTMATNYLKGYQAVQIPVVLPANIKEFTKITSKPQNIYSTVVSSNPNLGAGIQSIRVIELSEPLNEVRGSLTSNGFFSSETVLPLKGNVIAETQGVVNNYQGVWAPDKPTYKLLNYKIDESTEVNTMPSNDYQGVTVTFSDTFGSGFEHLLADVVTKLPSVSNDYTTTEAMPYVIDDKKESQSLGLPLYNLLGGYYQDPLTLTVAYYDDFDDIREVDIPFVTAYLMQLITDSKLIGSTDPSTWIAGIFQQGQTAGLRLNLSEFKSLISVKLSYGYGNKNPLYQRLHPMEGDSAYDDNDARRAPLKYDLSKDPIAIDSICFYDSVTRSNFYAKYNGNELISTIKTTVTPSCNWQASREEGQIITENHSFTAYKESREGHEVNMFDGAPIEKIYKNKYLVEITTLNKEIAGTISNLSYQLHYKNSSGNSISTTVSSLQGAARNFYGSSSRNLNITATDFQNKVQAALHLTPGSKFCFITELTDVKEFEGITLSSDGLDEWQPEQIRILKLTSLGERTATRTGAFLGNLSAIDIPDNMKPYIATNLGIITYQWDRTYTGTVLATATPNLLLHSGKTSARINFTIHNPDGTTVVPDTELEEIKYLERIPSSMTYEDTLVDLGLNIVKNTYEIHVDVANVADAGSSNYFYFQLLFQNGRSGLVLANQQLPSDSFRQGLTETFSIQTTQRYGDVKAVRIICEATASTASTFDKLNIEKITVTLNSQQGTGKSWIVDRVGWIDINYVDEVQQSYASDDRVVLENKDLTLDFPVTSTSSATELMFVITTGKQSGASAKSLNMTSLGDNIEGIITYIDLQGTTRTVNFDLAQKIMDFNENESTSRILRSGTMDRFVISLSDVKQIESLILTRNEGKNADWIVADITIHKIGGVGDVYLSSYTGEYIRDIEHSEYLTTSTKKDVALKLNDSKTFQFDPHEIEADISSDDNNAWNTTITRYPVTSDESLNIYIYLTNVNYEPYKFSDGTNSIDASVIYSSSMGTGALKASFRNIRAQATTETSSVLFAQGLSIQSVGSLKTLELRGNFTSDTKPYVRCVYIEHVQGNVIKDTLYVPFNKASLSLDKVSANISSLEALTPMKQIVRLQPKEDTSTLLTPESHDIAVALRYTSSLDPEITKMVYQSPYVFLTDVDYTILDNRNHIEVPFYISGVGEIVGLTVISSGPIVEFENALITNYPKPTTTDGKENEVTTLLGSCNIAEKFTSTNIVSKLMKTSKKVTPVTFTFTTPKEDLVAGCGTSGQVSMLITYTDSADKEQTYRITNILDYLPLDNPPFSDSVTSFNILMTDVAYLNSVTLTPATDDWFLTEVNAKVTNYDNSKQTTVNKTAVVNQWAKADGPLTIDMRPDSVNTDGPVINKITGFSISASAQHSKVTASASSGTPLSIKVVAGDIITFTPIFQKVGNPTANINWAAYKYEQFFTDYNNGSATFAVPTEEMITNEGLPKQYTLSAVCSENNSLVIPITIDVVTQEELDQAKEGTAKLTLVTLQDNKTIATAIYNESEDITLEVPAKKDANGELRTTKDTNFKFVTSLNKEGALLNVNNNEGLIVPSEDGTYEFSVSANSLEVSDYYLMFNVADAEMETTYSVTMFVSLIEDTTVGSTETPTDTTLNTSNGNTVDTTLNTSNGNTVDTTLNTSNGNTTDTTLNTSTVNTVETEFNTTQVVTTTAVNSMMKTTDSPSVTAGVEDILGN